MSELPEDGWTYRAMGENHGPVRLSELVDQIKAEFLSAESMAFHDSLGDWRPLREIVPEMFGSESRTRRISARLTALAAVLGIVVMAIGVMVFSDWSSYQAARKSGARGDYERYIAKHRRGLWLDHARRGLDEAMYVEALKVGSSDAFDHYLSRSPLKLRRDEATTGLDDALFWEAKREGTVVAYAEYIDRFPSGRHAKESTEGIEAVTSGCFEQYSKRAGRRGSNRTAVRTVTAIASFIDETGRRDVDILIEGTNTSQTEGIRGADLRSHEQRAVKRIIEAFTREFPGGVLSVHPASNVDERRPRVVIGYTVNDSGKTLTRSRRWCPADLGCKWRAPVNTGPAVVNIREEQDAGRRGFQVVRANRSIDLETPMKKPLNVLGTKLSPCCTDPVSGFFRDGSCRTAPEDIGRHVVCAEMTAEFLDFSAFAGHDLSTPVPEVGFPGLKPGDRWCLCASRWWEAVEIGVAPPVVLEATDESALELSVATDLRNRWMRVVRIRLGN